MRPGPEVLASFGASADPVMLPGGQGTAWRAGEVVLKPAGDPRVARWTADLYRDLNPPDPLDPQDPLDLLAARRDPGFRVPRPLRTVAEYGATGDWVAQDPLAGAWVAWQWLPGEPASWSGVSPFWPPLIVASRAFHAALAGRPAPPWLGRDGSQWTVGDQVAWGERDPGSVLAAAPGPSHRPVTATSRYGRGHRQTRSRRSPPSPRTSLCGRPSADRGATTTWPSTATPSTGRASSTR